jgi:serine/threonine-protein kinase
VLNWPVSVDQAETPPGTPGPDEDEASHLRETHPRSGEAERFDGEPPDSSSSIERVRDEAEKKLGRYELVYHIASGGMASVYLARVKGPGGFERAVAIKRIHPHLARKREFIHMFLDEARILSRLTHPNVSSALDFGEVEGTYFLAMEYLSGVTLAQLIVEVCRERDRLASRTWQAFAARILADAAEGLHAAHELRDERGKPLGLVHRDVSPHNVFVTYDGAVKVMDFGVALARGRLHHTTAGTIKGKLGYMAPEHASGKPIDRQADVWSLGVCAWEALTGRRLFRRGNEMDSILAVQTATIPPPSSIVPSVDPALDAIVLRALERDRAPRYATARELGAALEDFVQRAGQSAGPRALAVWLEPFFPERRARDIEIVKTTLHLHSESTVLKPDEPKTADLPPRRRSRTASIVLGLGIVLTPVGLLLGYAATQAVLALGRGEPESTAAREPTVVPRPEVPEIAAREQPIDEAVTEASETEVAGAIDTEAIADPIEAADPVEESDPVEASGETETAMRELAPEQAGQGTVSFAARGGWAEVYVDGRLRGETPFSTRLAAGPHVATFRFGNGHTVRRRFTVRPGGRASVSASATGR